MTAGCPRSASGTWSAVGARRMISAVVSSSGAESAQSR